MKNTAVWDAVEILIDNKKVIGLAFPAGGKVGIELRSRRFLSSCRAACSPEDFLGR